MLDLGSKSKRVSESERVPHKLLHYLDKLHPYSAATQVFS